MRAWFEAGGCLTTDAIKVEPKLSIDDLGGGLPARELALCDIGPDGVLGALRAGNQRPFDLLAERLARDQWVACRLGAQDSIYSALCAEGEASELTKEYKHARKPPSFATHVYPLAMRCVHSS